MSNSNRYIDEFVKFCSAPDMLAMELFPNSKEITESMAMFCASRKLGIPRGFPEVVVISVGDGFTPRTAALFAFLSSWTAVSIDPGHKDKKQWPVKRLYCFKSKVEDLDPTLPYSAALGRSCILVGCHSHATLVNSVKFALKLPIQRLAVISMECCVKDDLPIRPDLIKEDKSVWSPKNLIRTWKFRSLDFWKNIDIDLPPIPSKETKDEAILGNNCKS